MILEPDKFIIPSKVYVPDIESAKAQGFEVLRNGVVATKDTVFEVGDICELRKIG